MARTTPNGMASSRRQSLQGKGLDRNSSYVADKNFNRWAFWSVHYPLQTRYQSTHHSTLSLNYCPLCQLMFSSSDKQPHRQRSCPPSSLEFTVRNAERV